jgi:hypothetical protein
MRAFYLRAAFGYRNGSFHSTSSWSPGHSLFSEVYLVLCFAVAHLKVFDAGGFSAAFGSRPKNLMDTAMKIICNPKQSGYQLALKL